MFVRMLVHQGHWSVTIQRLLVQPMLGLENWVSDISVETCLLFVSKHLVCAGCQQDIAVGPNITRFLLFFQLQMRSCPGKKERLATGTLFLWHQSKERRKLTQMYWGLAEKFKIFLIGVRRHCGQKRMIDWSGHIKDGVSHCSACRGILIFEPLPLQKLTG